MRIERAVRDLEESEKILKKSKFPRHKLADLEFLEDGRVKQKRVVVLKDELERVGLEDGKKLIEKCVDFILEMWRYGIHKKQFKFYSNFGVLDVEATKPRTPQDLNRPRGGEIVLIDPFEITDDREKVVKQVKLRKWDKPHRLRDNSLRDLFVYFEEVCDGILTLENLDGAWGTKG